MFYFHIISLSLFIYILLTGVMPKRCIPLASTEHDPLNSRRLA